LGRDGWIYWCKGAFAEQTHSLVDGRTLTSSAAHIFRRKLSGGPLESVISGGMDNPVELAFTPTGDKFFTSTFLQHPQDGRRDGIGHAVYGGVFGKDHGVVEGLTRTGPLMTAMTHLGPAAPSGLIHLHRSDLSRMLVGDAEVGVLASALFNLQKVMLHRLVPAGASYRTVDHDLLVADRIDFHPTDVLEDADGSLLVLDTGGWYDLCCPTSRVDQQTAAGGIYRISSVSPARATEVAQHQRTAVLVASDGQPADVEHLVKLIADDRPWVRRAAEARLVSKGDAIVEPLTRRAEDTKQPLPSRQQALWLLCRLESRRAISAVAAMLETPQPEPLLQTLLQILSLHRWDGARMEIEELLSHDDLRVRRVAAQALGRIGSAESWPALLKAYARRVDDRHLEHALLYAMIEIGRRRGERIPLDLAENDVELAAVLFVQRQLDPTAAVASETLVDALSSPRERLAIEAAQWLIHRPSAAAAAMPVLQRQWESFDQLTGDRRDLPVMLFDAWQDQPLARETLLGWLSGATVTSEAQQQFFAARLHEIAPASWDVGLLEPLLSWFEAALPDVRKRLLTSLATAELTDRARDRLGSWLIERAQSAMRPEDQLRLLAAMPRGERLGSSRLEYQILEHLLSEEPDSQLLAAKALGRLRPSQMLGERLLQTLSEIPTRQIAAAVAAIHRTGDSALDEQLLAVLPSIAAARSLPADFLNNLYGDAAPSLRAVAAATSDRLLRAPREIRAEIDALLPRLDAGDPVRGLQVFRSHRAACSGCHRMGYVGTSIGPELTRIGRSRTREALLEAILHPNARIEQSYRSLRVLTTDGQTWTGLVHERTPRRVTLQINADQRITIERDRIETEQDSDVSIMPTGLMDVLSLQDLADLLSLLESAR
jgi:putative heme-binding domain-containing protein